MSVSLAMIVRNEESTLGRCLASVDGLVEEIVVVDTGSTDGTIAVAESFGARVSHFSWCDDFAAARNDSIEAATGDWILWLDGDEWLDEVSRSRFRELRTRLGDDADAFTMRQVSPRPGVTDLELDQVRLFRRRAEHRWRYRVHEQIAPAIRDSGGRLARSRIAVRHDGYTHEAVNADKRARNHRLVLLDSDDHPDDAFVQFNAGQSWLDAGDPGRAVDALERSLALLETSDNRPPRQLLEARLALARSLR